MWAGQIQQFHPYIKKSMGRQIGQINSGAFGVFSAKLSTPILYSAVSPFFPLFNPYLYKKLTINTNFHFCTESPLSMFFIIQPLFLQKTKPLYPHPKYLFGIRILIWAARNQGFSLRHTVFCNYEYPKKGHLLILLSRLAKESQQP